MLSCPVQNSASLSEACQLFLADLREWILACIDKHGDAPATNVHDQATYTISWPVSMRASDDVRPLGFMKDLRHRINARFEAEGRWRHGYWTMQEAHHGTEHFELFLGTLWRLDPADPETTRQLLDAAEHFGNWAPEIPPWFDWKTGLFRSFYFGTDGVKLDPVAAVNVPDHFRCVNIALLAHEMTGEARYLDLARLHASRWAEAILASSDLPAGLTADGAVFHQPGDGGERDPYRRTVGQIRLETQVDRAENFLASGAINALLRLWGLCDEPRFRAAAERLLDVIATQLNDPDAGPAADILGVYRRAAGDHRYDRLIHEAVERLDPFGFMELTLEPVKKRERRPPGIGKRADMPNWMEDGAPRRRNPILLAVAAEIAGDEQLAARAVDLARTHFRLAREAFPDGREHGCSARSVSAIARGHGRDNNAGMVTAVLGRAMEALGSSHEVEPSQWRRLSSL
ncbi:MAG: hypothetical protein NTW86_17365 [Candidatus Sumerlaeota bacterium]|nr:hypothetical protein [Candidatus Sumerlaeota bacterium]